MKPNINAFRKILNYKTYGAFLEPLLVAKEACPELKAEGNKPLSFSFDDQLNVLIYHHLQGFESGRHMLQSLEEDDLAKELVTPENGLKKSTFFEAISTRGLDQLLHVYRNLYAQAKGLLPDQYASLGDLVAIDGSFITATLSMDWADYRGGVNKAKVHLGLDVNHGIPAGFYLTDGKADERPFVSQILEPGQTGILDRYYQKHKNFDDLQQEQKHFVCRIKDNTTVDVIEEYEIAPDSNVFFDALVLLGTKNVNQTIKPVRLVKYTVDAIDYWVATDRFDLTAEEIALIYKLRWDVEKFFGWWKRQLNVYHLISRTEYGLMVQIVTGLITYLLLAIYCHSQYKEKVSIKRVRELRSQILNEALADRPLRRRSGKKKKRNLNVQKPNRTLLMIISSFL